MTQVISVSLTLLLIAAAGAAQRGQSPAAQRPPETLTPQSYSPDEVRSGEGRFTARCGFCHGRDAGGGEGGPDLTRSTLVARDAYGDRIGPMLSAEGNGDGVHAFELDPEELRAIVAFVHSQKTQAESVLGGRRFVEAADLRTGDAEAGRRYFDGGGGCSACHSPTGDLAGIASRFEGLTLLRRMLDPAFGRPAPAPATVRVTLGSGETITGPLAYQDEFTIALTDADGTRRIWSTGEVKFTVEDPLAAHFDQLGRYTDRDMHDVYAYLETLR